MFQPRRRCVDAEIWQPAKAAGNQALQRPRPAETDQDQHALRSGKSHVNINMMLDLPFKN